MNNQMFRLGLDRIFLDAVDSLILCLGVDLSLLKRLFKVVGLEIIQINSHPPRRGVGD